jgi:hypothetical protein
MILKPLKLQFKKQSLFRIDKLAEIAIKIIQNQCLPIMNWLNV